MLKYKTQYELLTTVSTIPLPQRNTTNHCVCSQNTVLAGPSPQLAGQQTPLPTEQIARQNLRSPKTVIIRVLKVFPQEHS